MRTIPTPTTSSEQSVASRSRHVLSLLLVVCVQPALPQPPATWVGQFGTASHTWQEVRLSKNLTPNQFSHRLWDGVHAMEVHSKASMSLMARPLSVDLETTPVLCWRWRVDATLGTADMTQRQGDDYAARVYVSFKLPEASLGVFVTGGLVATLPADARVVLANALIADADFAGLSARILSTISRFSASVNL